MPGRLSKRPVPGKDTSPGTGLGEEHSFPHTLHGAFYCGDNFSPSIADLIAQGGGVAGDPPGGDQLHPYRPAEPMPQVQAQEVLDILKGEPRRVVLQGHLHPLNLSGPVNFGPAWATSRNLVRPRQLTLCI